tara:strand:+ start:906 stop:1163 length:258 start_codon:yes stop_codon:yes gene_type:complete
MKQSFDKLMGAEPVRIFLILGLVAVAVLAAVLVSAGVTDKDTITWAVGLVAMMGLGVDRANQSKLGASSPDTVESLVRAKDERSA